MSQRLVTCAILLSALLFASCSKDDAAPSGVTPGVPWTEELAHADTVAPEGCLSIPRLYEGIRRISPDTKVVIVPTALSFESDRAVRENYRKLIAYGQLEIIQSSFSNLQNFPAATQEACQTFTLTGGDGEAKIFTVKESSATSLTGEAEDGERFTYTWLTSRSFQTIRRYVAFDVPCTDGDKPIFVSVSKTMSWQEPNIPAVIPEVESPLSIERKFLDWATAAVGESASSIYSEGEPGARLIQVPRLQEILERPPLAEVVSCNGLAPPAPPSPNEPTDPEEPPRDGDGPGPNP